MITLYSTNCPQCKILKQKLNEKNIKYVEINDEQTIIDKKFLSVPILEVGDKVMKFNEAIKWVLKK